MIRLAALLIALAAPVWALECQDITYRGTSYTICEAHPRYEDIRLFHSDADGQPLSSFRGIEREHPDQTLAFAMNAGMYHDDLSPVGHYVEGGVEQMRIIPNAGPGNFGMLPNGVFCISGGQTHVFETLAFAADGLSCDFATQSGPMLVIDGELHPRFIEGSTSRHIRNGVGTSENGDTAVFAISNEVVNFHDFASLFRDHLGLPNALYFDGKVSRLHAPDLGRSDGGFAMGPMVGILQ